MSCWCQRFRQHQEPDNRAALAQEIRSAPIPVGLLAYREQDNTPIGWTRVVPRATLPGVLSNRAITAVVGDDPHAWWVSCFVVRREHRGQGVGVAMLQAAADWAAQHGASLLDGHPVDIDKVMGPPSPAATFTGTLAMFQRAGFLEIGRTYKTRPVMRRTFQPSGEHIAAEQVRRHSR